MNALHVSRALLLIFATGCFAADDLLPIPATPKNPVVDDYHGVKVTDDYRWLEAGATPEVQEWSKQQNARTRAYLDHLPARAAIVERLKQLYSTRSPRFDDLRFRGGLLFALETHPPRAQSFLIALTSPDDPASARTIVDPNAMDPTGATTIDFYVPSHDGKLVAVSLSKNGSEDGSLSVFDAATGKRLEDPIPRVNEATAGGSVAWNGDSTGFWYTRYPRTGERAAADANFYQQVYFHKVNGAPGSSARSPESQRDEYALGRELPRIAEITLASSDDGKFVVAMVGNGDGGDFLTYVRNPDGRWHQIARIADQIPFAAFGPDNSLYVSSHLDAPMGKILQLSAPGFLLSAAKTVVTPGRSAIENFLPVGQHLIIDYMAGGPSKLVDKEPGKPERAIDIPPVSSVGQIARVEGGQVLFENESFVDAPAWYRYDPANGQVKKTGLVEVSPADFSDIEVTRVTATSKDGTKVPLNILRRKGTKLDESNPTLLTGYGGYSISTVPEFSASNRVWFDHGGVMAIANVRGGAEFGTTWHEQGSLLKKQNVFDDFIACAEYLIKAKYTSASKLAIEGASNGGLLMGAALTQRPDLFRAVASYVGIYDMLRVETFPNGVFNVTEFGTVKERDQFQALYGYSPYHHVKEGTDYPAVLFLTGENDARVDPMNSRKMVARLQAATSNTTLNTTHPIFLRTGSGGHGIGAALEERIEQEADVYAFLFDQLGMK
jgi:prolyl oligopeptidase